MSYEVLVQFLLESRYACLLGVVLLTKICRCNTILKDGVGPSVGNFGGLLRSLQEPKMEKWTGFCVARRSRYRVGGIWKECLTW